MGGPLDASSPPVPDPIQWHEGMLLHPQHFQQFWLRSDALLHRHVARIAPFFYGVDRIEVDGAALAAGRLRIAGLDAVMPDGLLIRDDGTSDALSLDLTALKDRFQEPQRIHLVVPIYRPASARPDDDLARWRSAGDTEVVDENSGTDSETIPRLRPRLRLRLGDDLPPRSVHLPLVEIAYTNQVFQQTGYVPPTVGLGPDSGLVKRCRDLAMRLREKAVTIAESQGGADRGAKQAVACLVAGLPPLETLLRLPAAHPFDLYMALQTIMGQVSTLRSSLVPPLTEPYDHLDPAGTLGPVIGQIDAVLAPLAQAFSMIAFQAAPNGFSLHLEDGWMRKELIVGLKPRPGQASEAVAAWMESALIASEDRLEELTAYRLRGAARVPVGEDVARTLSAGRDTMLYRITVDTFVRAQAALHIANPLDRGGAQRPAEIQLFVDNQTAAA